MTYASIRASPYCDVYLKAFCLTVCFALMTNCSLFKNTSRDRRSSHEQSTAVKLAKSAEQKDWLSKSGSVSFHQDSSNLDYSLQIWPKGEFSYSPEKGFSGRADKVLVTGKAKTGSVSSGRSSALIKDQGKIEQSFSEEEKKVSDQKQNIKTSSPSWKWIIAGLATLGLVGCFVYTKAKPIFLK